MNWTEILQQIFELCIVHLLGILTGCLIKVTKNRADEISAEYEDILTKK